MKVEAKDSAEIVGILIEREREGEIEMELEMERKIHSHINGDRSTKRRTNRPINGRALNLMARHSQEFSLLNNSEIIQILPSVIRHCLGRRSC